MLTCNTTIKERSFSNIERCTLTTDIFLQYPVSSFYFNTADRLSLRGATVSERGPLRGTGQGTTWLIGNSFALQSMAIFCSRSLGFRWWERISVVFIRTQLRSSVRGGCSWERFTPLRVTTTTSRLLVNSPTNSEMNCCRHRD
jgi:hypothetical protein